ncbi:hypothetical protein LOTGIDRAFT_159593 [Lottia gigantea]|uniref:Uncharacterized protein n=1 Tax=Lottia gigantea TaxID=225164 RepID=V4AT12_LOTGI|nr:hypothetical protein LOTGIDRAFT_159593 [Lottia gigantea]ESO96846.1 hypothetical protein LOTGIDRAFT_159593 [Lottia gigantea]
MLQYHVANHMSTLSINDKRQNAYPMYVNTKGIKLGLSTFWRSPYLNGTGLKKKKRELPIVLPPRMCSRQSVRSNRSSVRKGILKNSQPDSGSEDSRLTKKKLRRSRSFSVKAEDDVTKRVKFGENCKLPKDSLSEIVKLDDITKVAEECNNATFTSNALKSTELEPRPATAMGIERTSSLISIERTPCRHGADYVQNISQIANTASNIASNPLPVASNRPPPSGTRILRRANTAAAIIISNPIPEVSKPESSSTKPSDSCAAIQGDIIQARLSNSFLSPTQIVAKPEKPGYDISSEFPNGTPQLKFSDLRPPKPCDTIPYKPPKGYRQSKPNNPFNRPKTCIEGRRAMLPNHINFCDKDKTIRILKWLQEVDDVQLMEGKSNYR